MGSTVSRTRTRSRSRWSRISADTTAVAPAARNDRPRIVSAARLIPLPRSASTAAEFAGVVRTGLAVLLVGAGVTGLLRRWPATGAPARGRGARGGPQAHVRRAAGGAHDAHHVLLDRGGGVHGVRGVDEVPHGLGVGDRR